MDGNAQKRDLTKKQPIQRLVRKDRIEKEQGVCCILLGKKDGPEREERFGPSQRRLLNVELCALPCWRQKQAKTKRKEDESARKEVQVVWYSAAQKSLGQVVFEKAVFLDSPKTSILGEGRGIS